MSRLTPASNRPLDPERIALVSATAGIYAARLNRAHRHGACDRDDFRQEMVLSVLERSRRFDAGRAGWSTFVHLVMGHAAGDLARSLRARPITVSLETLAGEGCTLGETLSDRDGWYPSDPFSAIEQARALESALASLPANLRHLCALFARFGIGEALDRSGLSRAEFYRRRQELRFRLRSLGIRPEGTRPRKAVPGRAS